MWFEKKSNETSKSISTHPGLLYLPMIASEL